MFNAERLLSGMLREAMGGSRASRRRRRRRRRSGLGNLLGPAAGLGALGIAIAAFEHFTKKDQPSSQGFATPTPTAPGPPPPPSAGPPPPPSSPPAGSEGLQQQAVLLIQAMVAAANADGSIDEEERKAILDRLSADGLTSEERSFLDTQLRTPPSIESLVSQVSSPQQAEEVYIASLLAIEVDSEEERSYLDYLSKRLGLSEETVARIHRELEPEDPSED